MHPILIDLGRFEIPTYGLLMAAAFLAALRLGIGLARRDGIDADRITGLWIVILVAAIVGAKGMLYVVEWRYYAANPRALLTSWRSAGVYYGGFVAAAFAGWVAARRAGLPIGAVSDLAAAPLALGQSIGRLGCLAAGCCYGRPTDLPWAVTFSDPRAARITGVPLDVPLHPTQAYLSLDALLLCGLLLLLRRVKRRRGWADGVVFWAYVVLSGASRFALETLRDDPRGTVGPLSTSQAFAVVAVTVGAAALLALSRRRARTG